ncbi:hypothetical protein FB451DRAFT_1532794 [Mycena latifolia]|nr:hypothetical protein FB451DRAFT_1532794 [Mycena latifolia]
MQQRWVPPTPLLLVSRCDETPGTGRAEHAVRRTLRLRRGGPEVARDTKWAGVLHLHRGEGPCSRSPRGSAPLRRRGERPTTACFSSVVLQRHGGGAARIRDLNVYHVSCGELQAAQLTRCAAPGVGQAHAAPIRPEPVPSRNEALEWYICTDIDADPARSARSSARGQNGRHMQDGHDRNAVGVRDHTCGRERPVPPAARYARTEDGRQRLRGYSAPRHALHMRRQPRNTRTRDRRLEMGARQARVYRAGAGTPRGTVCTVPTPARSLPSQRARRSTAPSAEWHRAPNLPAASSYNRHSGDETTAQRQACVEHLPDKRYVPVAAYAAEKQRKTKRKVQGRTHRPCSTARRSSQLMHDVRRARARRRLAVHTRRGTGAAEAEMRGRAHSLSASAVGSQVTAVHVRLDQRALERA